MPHCCVPGCHVTGGKRKQSNEIKLHGLPKDAKRAKLWLKAIPRDWKNNQVLQPTSSSIRVCSLHFVERRPSKDKNAASYVPSIFPTNKPAPKPRATRNSGSHRIETHAITPDITRQKRVTPKVPLQSEAKQSHHGYSLLRPMDSQHPKCFLDLEHGHVECEQQEQVQPILDAEHALMDHGYSQPRPVNSQHPQRFLDPDDAHLESAPAPAAPPVTGDFVELEQLRSRLQQSEKELAASRRRLLTTQTITSTAECRQWTGLINYSTFEELLMLGMNCAWDRTARWCGQSNTGQKGHVRCLTPDQQLLLTLVRLKTNTAIFHLGLMFGVSEGIVSETFTTWIHMLHRVLKKCFHLPPKHVVKQDPAPCYKPWEKLVIVIDCTEIRIESPGNNQANKEVYSSYKQHDTAKFLVGSAPNMSLIYVSPGWGGRATDKTITLESSDLLGWLQSGDTVMSDKGFLVGTDLSARHIKLVMPPFKGSDRSQFTNQELEYSEKVSKARVHVERVIQRIKTFEILQGDFRLSMVDILDSIFAVCSYLVNLQPTTIRYS